MTPSNSDTRPDSVMGGWQPIESAPWQTVVEVRNPSMDDPVLATRGYAEDGCVHPDSGFFTSVFTPLPVLFFPAGRLVCPTEWRPAPPTKDQPA